MQCSAGRAKRRGTNSRSVERARAVESVHVDDVSAGREGGGDDAHIWAYFVQAVNSEEGENSEMGFDLNAVMGHVEAYMRRK